MYANGGASWMDGDFDYDGKITAHDFALLDAAYLNQVGGKLANDPYLAGDAALLGMTMSAYSALVTAPSTVPEPGSLALLAVSCGALLGRRAQARAPRR
jgi:hypothetical protein